ncbi:glycosyltransferase family 39 protein [Candidatus Pacearchaeota archaeon]|nr:glycosyltransferase family 39 protein [Candidatus Pacearchaeota archaeon]
MKNSDKKLLAVLIICILLRLVIFSFQTPFNNDKHFLVVSYIFQNNALPSPFQFEEAQHPPLYYIFASFFLFFGSAKAVQFFSLILSIGALIVFFVLIKKLDIPPKNKLYCLLFAGLLPQMIFFGNYISNDSLSIFLGSLIFFQSYMLIKSQSIMNHVLLAVFLGLGMLTKATFILFLPVLFVLIIFINFKNNQKILVPCLIFLVISLALGSYKYVNNEILYKNPFINYQEINPGWFAPHRGTYSGSSSFYDINIIKLIENPYVSLETKHSYPLMLYGTFWYQYIKDSNFNGKSAIFSWLGSLIYILAIIPTIIMIIGFFRIARNPSKNIFETLCLLLFLTNLFFIFYAGIKYDDWAFFQSRYLFQSFFSILIFLNSGINFIKNSKIRKLVYISLCSLFFLFVIYFAYGIYNLL